MTQRRVELSVDCDEAFQRLLVAFNSVGHIEEGNATTRTLTGKARYGLNPVRLRISVISATEGSVLDIQGRGQDVWGVASRKVIDRLISALDAESHQRESGDERPEVISTSSTDPPEDSVLDIVRERYARGEITREEFQQLKNDLAAPEP